MSLRNLLRGVSFFLVVVIVATSAPANQTGTARAAVPADFELVQAPEPEQAGAAPLPGPDTASNQAGLPEWLDAEDVPPPMLTVAADPFQVLPGDVITYSVAITNVADVSLTSTVLSSTLPAGVVYVAQSGVGFDYSPRDQRLTWAIDQLEPGQGLHGRFQLRATGLRMGELITNTVSAASAAAPPVSASAVVEVAPPRQNRAWATPGEGGWLRSEDGRVDLRVPAGAVEGRTEIVYDAGQSVPVQPVGAHFTFALNLRDEIGQPVSQFSQPARLRIWSFGQRGSQRTQDEVSILIFDESTQTWLPLDTQVTTLSEGAEAEISQSGVFALAARSVSNDPVLGLLIPSVLGARNSLWTGDSALSYPLGLPPAPGNSTPTLALSYSSGAANSLVEQHDNDRLGQASDFGLGWELSGGGAILRSGSQYFLQFPGGSYRLVNTGGVNWKTVPESFLQISHDSAGIDYRTEPVFGFCTNGQQGWVNLAIGDTASWTVRSPDGTAFVFGGGVDSNGVPLDAAATPYVWQNDGITQVPSNCTGKAGDYRGRLRLRPIRWNLTSVQPMTGTGLGWTYHYGHKKMLLRQHKQYIITEVINTSAPNYWERRSVMHTWLDRIEYGNGLYRVRLTYSDTTASGSYRTDTPAGFEWRRVWIDDKSKPTDWDSIGYTAQSQWLVSGQLVDDILVEAKTAADQPFRTIRLFDLQQTYHHHLALTSIVEKNGSGAALPATTFTYHTNIGNKRNGEALATVNNGQGGAVSFAYGIKACGVDLTCPTTTPQAPQNGRIVVESRTVSSLPGQNQSVESYAYTGGQYVRPDNDWQFWGFGTVSERFYSPAISAPIRRAVTLFNQTDEQRKGKINQVTIYAGESGPELTKTINTWVLGYWTIGTSTTQHAFPRLDYVDEYIEGQSSLRKHLLYDESPYQNGRQFGNVTRVEELLPSGSTWASTPIRTTYTWYFPNYSVWSSSPPANPVYIVNKPARVERYHLRAGVTGARLDSQTLYFYDQMTSYSTPPIKGLLRRQSEGDPANTGNPGIVVADYEYNANGSLWKVKDGKGNATETYYDSAFGAFPTCVKNALGHVMKTSYYGVPGSSSGACTTTAGSAAFDGNGQPISGAHFGQVQDVTDANGALTSYTYDAWGRLASMWRPGDVRASGHAATEVYVYTAHSSASAPFKVQKRQREDVGGANAATYLETYTFYDGLGRVIQTQAEAENAGHSIIASTRYDAQGPVAQANLPYLFTSGSPGAYRAPDWGQANTRTEYDALGRVKKVIQPNGAQVCTFYQGMKTAVVNERNYQTVRESDALGRLVAVKEYYGTVGAPGAVCPGPNWAAGANGTTTYGYDAADRLTSVVGPDAASTTIGYDIAGRKTSMVDPSMGAWGYGYDAVGNLVRQTDARNQRVCLYYDVLNRPKGKTYSTGAAACPNDPGYSAYAVKFYYDTNENGALVVNGKGRRTVMVDASGRTAWEYDGRGRVFKETKSIAGWRPASQGTTNRVWVYDSMDRLVEMTVDEADGFHYQYDPAGRLYRVYRLGNEQVTMFYNALGQVTERRLGYQAGMPNPELRQTFTYPADRNFRLSSLRSGLGPGYNGLQNISYTYDGAGNVLTISDSAAFGGSQVQTFTYDALNRVLTAQAAGGNSGAYTQRSYNYNNAGNMTAFEGTSLHYLDTIHRHAITHVGGTAPANQKYWYDANGNAIRRISGSQDISLAYDTENRLMGVVGNGINASYIYDGDGKLVKTVVNGLTSFYPYPELEVIESTPGVFREKYYMIVDGVRLSVQDRSAWPPVKNYWLLGDHLGSTAITVDGTSGNRVTELRYYPYGSVRYDAGSQLTNYWFTGQRREASTGLYFYQSRWYDPVVGRFLSADTIVPEPGDPQALNRYSYVLNNPLRYTDPTGMFSEDEIEQFLRDQYGDLWQDYWNAWNSDDVFWGMLLAAQYGDVLWAPTSGLDAGIFGHSGATFTLHGEHELYEYQGVGPYFLNNNPGTTYTGHPLDGSGVVNQRWEQPQYEYVSGEAPRYTGYNRVVRYGLVGAWFSITEGSGMPYIVGLGAQAWRKLATRVPSILCTPCTTYLTGLTAVMAVNNAVFLEYTMGVEYRSVRDPSDRLETWYQLLYPELTAQPS